MRSILIFLILVFCNCIVFSQSKNTKMIIYYIPGQGADHRLFNNIELGENHEVRFVKYDNQENVQSNDVEIDPLPCNLGGPVPLFSVPG